MFSLEEMDSVLQLNYCVWTIQGVVVVGRNSAGLFPDKFPFCSFEIVFESHAASGTDVFFL